MKKQNKPGRVAVQQAMRELGLSFGDIAKKMCINKRTAFSHIKARPGSNVTPWDCRTDEQKRRATRIAKRLISSK